MVFWFDFVWRRIFLLEERKGVRKNPRFLLKNGGFFPFKERFCVVLRTEYSNHLPSNRNNGLPDVT